MPASCDTGMPAIFCRLWTLPCGRPHKPCYAAAGICNFAEQTMTQPSAGVRVGQQRVWAAGAGRQAAPQDADAGGRPVGAAGGAAGGGGGALCCGDRSGVPVHLGRQLPRSAGAAGGGGGRRPPPGGCSSFGSTKSLFACSEKAPAQAGRNTSSFWSCTNKLVFIAYSLDMPTTVTMRCSCWWYVVQNKPSCAGASKACAVRCVMGTTKEAYSFPAEPVRGGRAAAGAADS